jgi:hypothetical protein
MGKITITIITLVLLCSGAHASEGSEPYSPSKLEWFAMDMNVSSKTDISDGGMMMMFVGLEKSNEVLIYVRYLPSADRELINTRIKNARELIKIRAKNYGWDNWLKIKEDVKMENLK